MTVRTRFAPSPTGRLHLGNVRTAAFNWLFARHHDGAFVLRVEDTDEARSVEGGEEGILEDLRWLGLQWDEGPGVGGPHAPYRQSERSHLHAAAAERLLEKGSAYRCWCTEDQLADRALEGKGGREVVRYDGRCRRLSAGERQELASSGRPSVLRFAVPTGFDEVDMKDEVFGRISFPASDMDDFVICRADGRATYNFAVVVDDVEMEITHVIRGVGHLSNTPKQALLFDALGAERPVFAHLPTVLGEDGGKLSKRSGAMPVAELRERGYPPDAVLNYLSLLGWSHPEEREILGRAELVEAMGLDRIGKSDTRVDPEKLRWVSSQHLAREELDDLTARVLPHLDAETFPGALADPEAVVGVLRSRMATYGEVNEHLPLLFPPQSPEIEALRAELRRDEEARTVLEAVAARLSEIEESSWDPETLGGAVRDAGADVGARGRALFHPVRRALFGMEQGPDLGASLAAVGKEEAMDRLRRAIGAGRG